jgi:hypothetical protein
LRHFLGNGAVCDIRAVGTREIPPPAGENAGVRDDAAPEGGPTESNCGSFCTDLIPAGGASRLVCPKQSGSVREEHFQEISQC